MIGKKINQLATELAPVSTDLTIIGDPISGVSKKITLAQLGAIFSGAVSFYTNLAGFPATGDINVIYCAKDTQKLYLWSGSAYVEVFPSQALLDTYQLRSEKGNANGYASLDSQGKVPISQLPSSIMEYKGTWNASTNTPTLANGTGDTGDVYICNVAGTVNFGAGAITFAVGDYVIYSGTIWQRSSGAVGTVTSVAVSRSGDALAITGSPVTTSGTINIGFAGTGAQYIKGDGTLATFPSIISQAQNLVTEVYNSTGATLTKGTVVYINGGQGNLPTVTKALATGDSTSAQTYGIVQADITNMNNGYVVVAGRLSDIDTQAYTEGTQLYLSSTTAGAYTSTKQYAPAHLVYIGIIVRSHPTQGIIEVKIQNGYELDELHNVAAQSPSNGDILQYVSSTSLWTKVAGTTTNIAEGTNLYYTDARSRASISETVTGLDYNNTTGVLSLTSGYVIPTTTNETNWNAAYNDKINSAAVTGTTTKTLTLTQQDGGTITASWTDDNTDAVTSVFGRTGAVVAVSGDYTTSLVTEGTNLYFTNARARAAISAGTGISYNSSTGVITNTITQYTDALARAAISLTTTGTSGAATYNSTTGVLNIPQYADQFVGTVTSVGLSAPTGFSVSGSPVTSSGTLALSFASGYSLPTTAKQTTWDTAYDRSLTAASVSGTTTKTLTLTKQDGSTLTASWTDINTDAVTSVFGRTGAVVATSGDYTTAQVTESGNLYFTNARAIASTLTGYTSGAGTITSSDSILSAIQKLNGNIGALTTGVSSVNGLTGAVTLTTSNIAEGTNLYYTEARVSANTDVAANTAARHNAVTLGTANGLSLSTQVLSLGLASGSTTGALSSTDWNTFNNKTSNTGTVTSVGLSSSTSGVTIGSTPITTSGTITLAIATASGSQQGLLSSTDWTTFNNKQNALTNPVTGTGTTNYLPKFTGTSTIGNSIVQDNGSVVTLGGAITVNVPTDNTTVAILHSGGGTANRGLKISTFVATNDNAGVTLDAQTSTGVLAFATAGTERMRLNASGNLGLGVTPSAWASGLSVFQGSSSLSVGNSGNGGMNVLANAYYGSNWTYVSSAASSWYQQIDGKHAWYNAPSGTAGNAISFTQAMTLNASGNLSIGNTNDTYKLDVSGSARFSGVASPRVYASGSGATGFPGYNLSNTTQEYEIIVRGNASNAFQIRNSTASTDLLSIASTGAATFSSSVTIQGNDLDLNNGSVLHRITNDNTNLLIRADYGNASANSTIQFSVDGSERMRITSGGLVNIGTTTAYTSRLNVQSTSPSVAAIKAGYGGVSGNGYTILADNYTTNESLMSIGIDYSSGGLVLGSAMAPSTTTQGAFISTQAQFGGFGSAIRLSTSGEILFYRGTQDSVISTGSPKGAAISLFINNSGNVGIGTTSPSHTLDVTGTGRFTSDVKVKTLEITNVGTYGSSAGISTYMAITVNGQNYVIPLHGTP